MATETTVALEKLSDTVDLATFEQILEMDDDESDREFSSSIVFGFFEQAETTFDTIEKAIASRDLPQLSSLGHFLKGSSATIGMYKVKDSCEAMQHYGASKNEKGEAEADRTPDYWLSKISATFETLKVDYKAAERDLKSFFEGK